VVLASRYPGAYVWLVVVMKVVKEFASQEALIAQPHQMKNFASLVHLIDSDLLG
jgi:hypothetical protein